MKIKKSYLPTTQSKAINGTAKQIDYSVACGDTLIIVECKAVARSFGIFSGDPTAQSHRLKNVIDKGLNEVDIKIEWLINNLKGVNYDITAFNYIVGIAVSAFLEFIPSEEEKYWLSNEIPRVLTVGEFNGLMQSDIKSNIKKNLILVNIS